MSSVGQHGVEGGGELPGPVPDEDGELVGPSAQVHEQDACVILPHVSMIVWIV
jgi:hypothetical protein